MTSSTPRVCERAAKKSLLLMNSQMKKNTLDNAQKCTKMTENDVCIDLQIVEPKSDGLAVSGEFVGEAAILAVDEGVVLLDLIEACHLGFQLWIAIDVTEGCSCRIG